MSVLKNKAKLWCGNLKSAARSRAVLGGLIILLAMSLVYANHKNTELSAQQNYLSVIDFHDQFYQGKACGLLTTVEAAKWLGTPVGTSGSVSPADGPTADTRPGSPRIDSCQHTAIKSSDGYIDVVLKTYSSQKDAVKYYDQTVTKLFTISARTPDDLGQRLFYGDGAFYLERHNMVIELSASKTPRVGSAETENLAREILNSVVAKL